jgi:NAD(P)-dependent dehydrogenase (short-subunit alcohol dehydrogenase family)
MGRELTGNVAVITGAAQGLGLAIAKAFHQAGAHVVLTDRDSRVTEAAQEIISARGEAGVADAVGKVADITDYPAIQRLAEEVWQTYGRCDHVVHAAATGSGKMGFPFWNLDPADWEPVLRVNLLGTAHIAHAFAPKMAEARQGTLLFIASVAGQIGSQTDPPYSASKAGVINFAQCAARDLAPYGVRVNALCPGMVKTTLNRAVYESWRARQTEEDLPAYEQWAQEKIERLVPLGRWQEPEDIANMAVFLASPRAANVTGQTINVDGGYVMHS